jgi:hypothetical protein
MTFTLILTLNLVLDVAIIATLAFVMSRAGKLTPNGAVSAPQAARARASQARRRRVLSRLRPLLG